MLRIVRVGVVAALVAGVAGYGIERSRFGASDAAAVARIEAELRERFDASARTVGAIAARVAADPAAATPGMRDQAAIRQLFALTAATLPPEREGPTGVTIYDATGAPIAWAGRVSDLPIGRVQGAAALVIAPGALGPRLIRVEPVVRGGARVATVVAEQSLGTNAESPGLGDTFGMATSIAPVTLRVPPAGTTPPDAPYRFIVPERDSAFVLEGEVAPGDLALARAGWRATTQAVVLAIVAVTLLLCMGPVIDVRRRARETSRYVVLTAILIVMIVVARLILYFALTPIAPSGGPTPFDLLFTTLTMSGVVWLALDLIERRRYALPRVKLLPASEAMPVVGAYAIVGFASGLLLWGYQDLLRRVVADTDLDLLHFSLHPVSAARIALEFALVLLHASVVWTAATVVRVPSLFWRLP